MNRITETACILSSSVHIIPMTQQTVDSPKIKTWKDICDNPAFQDLPYKIEMNKKGKIDMSPMYARHGYFQVEISFTLKKLLSSGKVVSECAIQTADGTKVADVGFFTKERWAVVRNDFDVSISPEIAVEILSYSNSTEEILGKKDLYFAAGSLEFWICDLEGNMSFYDHSGKLEKSKMAPDFPKFIEE